MRRITSLAAGILLSAAVMGMPYADAAVPVAERPSLAALPQVLPSVNSARTDKVRVTWDVYKDAVRYRLSVWASPQKKKLLYQNEWISLPGRELELSSYRRDKAINMDELVWSVTPLDRTGKPIAPTSELRYLRDGEIRPESPRIVSEYDRMEDAPLYPVYAWLSVADASSYEVEVWRRGENGSPDERVRHLYTYENIMYDEQPLTWYGNYKWRVRALDGNGRRYSEWSEWQSFVVLGKVKYAALGDSITHGGGAISTPPCMKLYNWESYTAPVSVKNLGCSGNTTADMLARFERDVLPFQPEVLVILGGVNDFREGTSGSESVANLAQLRDKCNACGIIPVFVTAPPIRPEYMVAMEEMEPASEDWRSGQETINEWVRQQPYHIDITEPLTDEDGELRAGYTSDGLHPDAEPKKIIGEIIGKYLFSHFGK